MKTVIGTLGPEGTFSDIATKKYIEASGFDFKISYFKSIKSTLLAVGKECDFGILPIENYSEGFVSVVLDTMVDSKLFIIGEVLLPIHFSFVTNAKSLEEVKTLFVQFVAKNQCCDFIDSLGDIDIVSTESNIASLDSVKRGCASSAGAIVPASALSKGDFLITHDNVNDFYNNKTRFLVFSSKPQHSEKREEENYKTSIVVYNDHDRPGLLETILTPFSKRNINLISITSRPTKKTFGRYNFFIAFEGYLEDAIVNAALKEVGQNNRLSIFGSYPIAR